MELYLYRRKKELKDFIETYKFARLTAKQTGKSFLYHWLDAVFCYLRHGCGPLQYFEGGFYKLRSFDRKKTYTKRRINKVRARYNDKKYEYFLDSKTEFNKHFADLVKREWIDCKTASATEIEDFVKKTGYCLMKPTDGSKGKGIKEINQEDAKSFSLSYAGKDYMLEEIIKQHPMMCFNNKSVNTLRVVTIMDKLDNVHIIKVTLRCGVGNSVVDNVSAGGVAYPIDFLHGRIEGPGVSNSLGQQIYIHPGTNIYMIGRDIPLWQQTMDLVKKAAKRIPQVSFVGWDIAITNESPVLIEGNQHPGAMTVEAIGNIRGLYKQMMSYQ